jgi:hypothetical protein
MAMPRERAAEKGPEHPTAPLPLDSRSLRLSPRRSGPTWQDGPAQQRG